MKTSSSRGWLLAVASGVCTRVAQAHPGHDDGHELTWDLGHLAAHPLATALLFAVMGAVLTVGWKLARRGSGQSK